MTIPFCKDKWIGVGDHFEAGESPGGLPADKFEGELISCNEGTLEWVPKKDIYHLNLWEGDIIFHRLLDEDAPFFSLKLVYEGDKLVDSVLIFTT